MSNLLLGRYVAMKRSSNDESCLRPSLNKLLSAYALACGGAVLAVTAQPANAEVVFKPTHRTITNGVLIIPIAHTDDFGLKDEFYTLSGSWSSQLLTVNPEGGAAVVGNNQSASALYAGVVVGPAAQFQTGKLTMAGAFQEVQVSSTRIFGPFANTTNRFLGVKFAIRGKVHYGWVRFSRVTASAHGKLKVSATLTGYAYETVPGKTITTGQIHDEIAGSRRASLGQLARGAARTSVAQHPPAR